MDRFQSHSQNMAQRLHNIILSQIVMQLLHANFWNILDLSIKYLKFSTFRTSLAFQMSMQEGFGKVNFSKCLYFGPI